MKAKSQTQTIRPVWTWFILGGVLVLLLAALAATTINSLNQLEALSVNYLASHGTSTVRSLEGATRASMRHGVRRRFKLQILAEEMAADPYIRSIVIFLPDGRVTAAAGDHQNALLKNPAGGLPASMGKLVGEKKPFTYYSSPVMVVGRAFQPFRRFLSRGRDLPSWACPMDTKSPEADPESGRPAPAEPQVAPPEPPPGPPPEMGRGMGYGGGMGRGRMMGRSEWRSKIWGSEGTAYVLIRLSNPKLAATQAHHIRQGLVLAGLIFAATGTAAWALWALARRRSREVDNLKEEIARNQHLASVGRLAGSIAHEVRNPLSALRGLVQLLGKGAEPGSQKEQYAKVAVAEVDRLGRVVGGLLDYTRPRKPRRIPLDIQETATGTIKLLADDPRADGVELAVEGEKPAGLFADPDLIRQLLLNLVLNSLEAVNGQGKVSIILGRENGQAVIRVRDNGPGLPQGDPEQLFDPFFSTRERGSGLGLAIARQIARAHGGDLNAENLEPGGAQFTLRIPLGEANES